MFPVSVPQCNNISNCQKNKVKQSVQNASRISRIKYVKTIYFHKEKETFFFILVKTNRFYVFNSPSGSLKCFFSS